MSVIIISQRIEAWWSFQRRDRVEWWIQFFKHLADSGDYNKGNIMET